MKPLRLNIAAVALVLLLGLGCQHKGEPRIADIAEIGKTKK